MILQRTALNVARRMARGGAVQRCFSTSLIAKSDATPPAKSSDTSGKQASLKPGTKDLVGVHRMRTLSEIRSPDDLIGPGAQPGTVPTDLEQATGLERLEILGKNEGIDIFDMKPLDASRLGTMDNPIMVKSFGEEQYAGCTGFPADSHSTLWLTLSRSRPLERCPECGNVLKMEYVGPADDAHGHDDHGHGHDHHGYQEPKTMADFIPVEYRYQ